MASDAKCEPGTSEWRFTTATEEEFRKELAESTARVEAGLSPDSVSYTREELRRLAGLD